MWRRRKKIEEDPDSEPSKPKKKVDPVDRAYQKTLKKISDLDSIRKKYLVLTDEMQTALGDVGRDTIRIPLIGKKEEYLSLERHLVCIKRDDIEDEDTGTVSRYRPNIYFRQMTWKEIEDYPLSLLKRSFVRWAEKHFEFGYNSLYG